eukprot:645114-Hanusia_phi.AAC.2
MVGKEGTEKEGTEKVGIEKEGTEEEEGGRGWRAAAGWLSLSQPKFATPVVRTIRRKKERRGGRSRWKSQAVGGRDGMREKKEDGRGGKQGGGRRKEQQKGE